MNEEQIIDKVSMIDQWKVSGDSYTQGELDAIGQLLELYYDNKKQLEQEKEKNKELYEQNQIYLSNGSNVKLELHIKNNYIRKDKIRKKLEHQNMLWNVPNRQKEYNQEFAECLEELLEEK